MTRKSPLAGWILSRVNIAELRNFIKFQNSSFPRFLSFLMLCSIWAHMSWMYCRIKLSFASWIQRISKLLGRKLTLKQYNNSTSHQLHHLYSVSIIISASIWTFVLMFFPSKKFNQIEKNQCLIYTLVNCTADYHLVCFEFITLHESDSICIIHTHLCFQVDIWYHWLHTAVGSMSANKQ